MNPYSIKNNTNTIEATYVLPNPPPYLPSRYCYQITFYPVFYFVSETVLSTDNCLGLEARNGLEAPSAGFMYGHQLVISLHR